MPFVPVFVLKLDCRKQCFEIYDFYLQKIQFSNVLKQTQCDFFKFIIYYEEKQRKQYVLDSIRNILCFSQYLLPFSRFQRLLTLNDNFPSLFSNRKI